MPAISKIRFVNVVYEDGNKRYNDETFQFDGHNGAIILENGGGKTVFIQTAVQTVLPHADVAGRKMKDTLSLENGPAHVAIEWILSERPRRYALTCVTLMLTATGLDSFRYAYDYSPGDPDAIDHIPFVRKTDGKVRPADRGEIQDYYHGMIQKRMNARLFATIKEYKEHLEEQYHIIPVEWERIVKINGSEGGVEAFFDECKTTTQLFDRLLIPAVEDAMAGYKEGEFAAQFETHREGFRKYKELKEKVEENRQISAELASYVQAFSKLHEREKDYVTVQSEAKAYWQLAGEQESERQAELNLQREQKESWLARNNQRAEKKDSLLIAEKQQELEAEETSHGLIDDERQEVFGRQLETDKYYYSLRLAEYERQRVQAAVRMDVLQAELALAERTHEEQELAEA